MDEESNKNFKSTFKFDTGIHCFFCVSRYDEEEETKLKILSFKFRTIVNRLGISLGEFSFNENGKGITLEEVDEWDIRFCLHCGEDMERIYEIIKDLKNTELLCQQVVVVLNKFRVKLVSNTMAMFLTPISNDVFSSVKKQLISASVCLSYIYKNVPSGGVQMNRHVDEEVIELRDWEKCFKRLKNQLRRKRAEKNGLIPLRTEYLTDESNEFHEPESSMHDETDNDVKVYASPQQGEIAIANQQQRGNENILSADTCTSQSPGNSKMIIKLEENVENPGSVSTSPSFSLEEASEIARDNVQGPSTPEIQEEYSANYPDCKRNKFMNVSRESGGNVNAENKNQVKPKPSESEVIASESPKKLTMKNVIPPKLNANVKAKMSSANAPLSPTRSLRPRNLKEKSTVVAKNKRNIRLNIVPVPIRVSKRKRITTYKYETYMNGDSCNIKNGKNKRYLLKALRPGKGKLNGKPKTMLKKATSTRVALKKGPNHERPTCILSGCSNEYATAAELRRHKYLKHTYETFKVSSKRITRDKLKIMIATFVTAWKIYSPVNNKQKHKCCSCKVHLDVKNFKRHFLCRHSDLFDEIKHFYNYKLGKPRSKLRELTHFDKWLRPKNPKTFFNFKV